MIGVALDEKSRQDPMTEIALALAMGFFSVMVLCVVSLTAEPAADVISLADDSADAAGATRAEGGFVVYWNGRFLDETLRPVDPETLRDSSNAARIVLGTSPHLSIAEAMDARAHLGHERVVVTRLSREWLETLERRSR